MSYKCNNCGYESTKFFALCPKCRDGEGEEISPSILNTTSLGSGINNKIEIRTVDANAKGIESFKSTKYPSLNAILSTTKGFVEGQVILLGASPGVGKSTLCISISDEDTLYISSEENYDQVNQRALRVNPNSKCGILNTTSIDVVLKAIKEATQSLIIIDSINSIEFGVGYQTVARYVNEITQLIKSLNKVCIMISQVGRTGEIIGMNAIPHMVDTVLHLEKSEISSDIIAVCSKNRYGEIGGVAVFRHEADGFKEVELQTDDSIEIGSTHTETQFGHKKMKITIDALVADAQSAYGLRKSNGYNQNRLVQLIGILSYYGKLYLTSKDIYVAVSNGLTTNDISIELAMANSIISSYYGKNLVKEAYGEVKLNGRVNGHIDGEPITHIKELLNIYKKK